ncbi:MAG TPA: phosphotransferase family protein [Solirubrobacteraceae bacterium]|nr:phosphotransferase family protein [Solirubrobacteraceae bacterium]
MSADLTEQLADSLGGAEIRELRQLTGGASRETWSFEAVLADGTTRELIARRDRPGRGALTVEAAAIEAAARAGVPEPEIVAVGESVIVMERVEGETIPRRILRDDAYADVRPRLASQCGEILARIHSIPVDEVPGLGTHDALEDVTAMIHAFDDPSPALELGLDWLTRHRPTDVGDCVLHGDFRNGNLIVGDDGIRAVLDWELVHRGDPMQDLGYLCVRAWRFGGELPVGGFGSYDDLFSAYERVSGRVVDPGAVRWWEVFGTVWWGGACMLQAWRHLSGAERSVELAAIGRRAWEQEYDVLLAIAA